ncbi:GTP cyclohydrolase II [Temperatibacter marinus]|uniref:GTP cyclohydrolase-2 n=1 Tax=Temperatibacter marinus TaxID=1456591 RepID=A0AA52HBB0_9PROT|nr:GTP cyclohydrolase II [Temperatibacter marinus]WND03458.1 GTP cyclohydrolase II [Temperatibacter marinus]
MLNFLNSDEQQQAAILRVADDLRRGQPILVREQTRFLMVFPAEFANKQTLPAFDQIIGQKNARLLITDNRALALKVAPKGWPVVGIERPVWFTPEDMVALADPTLDLATPLKGPFKRIDQEPDILSHAAIKALKIARLLPAALVADLDDIPDGLLAVSAENILEYEHKEAELLTMVARANVPLAGAEKAQLVSFRPKSGGVEHIAIVVGDPPRGESVLARLHSECFTGDLLGSLKCDCGEQLSGAIKNIGQAGGGLILYMAQEGRGIGLTSKLKAYSLQDQGYDTVDANTALGFDVDERLFYPAAEMIKQLGFTSIRLMTNNPNKVIGLERAGISIAERVPHYFETNKYNEKYLEVKRDRTGHLL